MKKSILSIAVLAGVMAFSSCASKKDLENCRLQNNELTTKFQDSKEQLAAANERINSLSDQLALSREQLAELCFTAEEPRQESEQHNRQQHQHLKTC